MGGGEALSSDTVQAQVKAALDGLKSQIAAKPEPNAYIVQTWKSGSSWYRVYSDGFIEQGGAIDTVNSSWTTVSFHKPYAGTNYTVHVIATGSSFSNEYGAWVNPASTQYFQCALRGYSGNRVGFSACRWTACGY